jgi:hypothetical protein
MESRTAVRYERWHRTVGNTTQRGRFGAIVVVASGYFKCSFLASLLSVQSFEKVFPALKPDSASYLKRTVWLTSFDGSRTCDNLSQRRVRRSKILNTAQSTLMQRFRPSRDQGAYLLLVLCLPSTISSRRSSTPVMGSCFLQVSLSRLYSPKDLVEIDKLGGLLRGGVETGRGQPMTKTEKTV